MRREYRVQDRTVEVDEETELLAIRLPDGMNPQSGPVARWRGHVLQRLSPEDYDDLPLGDFEAGGWLIVRIGAEDPGRRLPEPVAVGRVFRDAEGRWMLGAGYLTVRLDDDLDDEAAQQRLLDQGLAIVRRLDVAPQVYEVHVPDDEDLIDTVNRLHDSGDYIYAHPQMIRKFDYR